jgi:hypothetical protein
MDNRELRIISSSLLTMGSNINLLRNALNLTGTVFAIFSYN